MGLLTDMLASYATGVSQHTGLHYVPSFNDLNSGGIVDEKRLCVNLLVRPNSTGQGSGSHSQNTRYKMKCDLVRSQMAWLLLYRDLNSTPQDRNLVREQGQQAWLQHGVHLHA